MQVVWLAETLESYSIFNEAHWFSAFVISFTAACLVLFVMSNEGDPTLNETEDAVRRIKNLCYRHSDENRSLHRCYKFLEVRQYFLVILGQNLMVSRASNQTVRFLEQRAVIHSMNGAENCPLRSTKPINYLTIPGWIHNMYKAKTYSRR